MLLDFVYDSGRTIGEIIGIIAGVGLIVGGLSMTGVSLSLARELITLVDGNIILILIAGAHHHVRARHGDDGVGGLRLPRDHPGARHWRRLGINPIAGHLFVIYWATVSYITPPVALASFAAANIAKTPPMATSFVAMRLGAVKYIIPFAFVFNPALLAQDSGLVEIIYTLVFAVIGVFFLGCAFEGWAIGIERRMHAVTRVVMGLAGIVTLAPELISSLLGLGVGVLAMVVTRFINTGEAPTEETPIEDDAVAEALARTDDMDEAADGTDAART